jgi:uncharacterized membrane protein
VLMIPLRRLSQWPALVVSVSMIALLELVSNVMRGQFGAHVPLWATLLVVPGNRPPLFVAYPTLHWLALMLLGWAFGKYLLEKPQTPAQLSRKLLAAGGALLLAFAAIRGFNRYGNMALYREHDSLVQWLHVSKYPPGLSYVSLELGLCFLCLAGLFKWSERRTPKQGNLCLVLGQTPLFFYLLHFPLLELSARVLGIEHALGIGAAFLGAAAVIALLYPVCRVYRRYKSAHKHSWLRYI